jgi:hypothetical protein
MAARYRRESPTEAWCVAWARFRGIVVAKMTGCNGIPDRIFFLPGGAPIIGEFKAKGRKGKGLQGGTQPWYLAKLIEDGYETYCWDTKEAFLEVMKGRLECLQTVASKTRKSRK